MKILKSFDTKTDAEELLEATENYNEDLSFISNFDYILCLYMYYMEFVCNTLNNDKHNLTNQSKEKIH